MVFEWMCVWRMKVWRCDWEGLFRVVDIVERQEHSWPCVWQKYFLLSCNDDDGGGCG